MPRSHTRNPGKSTITRPRTTPQTKSGTSQVGYSPDREARDALYALGQDGFTCYEPDDGIRCEKTWDHPTLPVKQGRTVFYRDGVFVDTQYSNLAPTGYTNAVIDSLWPASPLLPAPTPSATP